jgi:hypothetical protein
MKVRGSEWGGCRAPGVDSNEAWLEGAEALEEGQEGASCCELHGFRNDAKECRVRDQPHAPACGMRGVGTDVHGVVAPPAAEVVDDILRRSAVTHRL